MLETNKNRMWKQNLLSGTGQFDGNTDEPRGQKILGYLPLLIKSAFFGCRYSCSVEEL